MTDNRADRPLGETLPLRMRMHFIRMMLQARIRDRTNLGSLLDTRVVWRQDRRDGTDDGTDSFVHLLVLRRIDGLPECGARLGAEVDVGGDSGVLVQDVVVVCGCFGDGAHEAGGVHVEIGVGRWKDGVGGAYDGADLLGGGCHGVVVGVKWYVSL